jgi:hypothetical protein
MNNNFKKGLNGDYRDKLTPNKLKVLCEVIWVFSKMATIGRKQILCVP